MDRAPFDGVLLTHAHIGHYLGLAHFGFESLNTKDLPVYVSPRMAEYLRTNGPWSQLVRLGNVKLVEIKPGEWFSLGEGISVKGFAVPHRDEYSDTLAFLIRGPKRTLLYVPDTDSWDAWGGRLDVDPLEGGLLEDQPVGDRVGVFQAESRQVDHGRPVGNVVEIRSIGRERRHEISSGVSTRLGRRWSAPGRSESTRLGSARHASRRAAS